MRNIVIGLALPCPQRTQWRGRRFFLQFLDLLLFCGYCFVVDEIAVFLGVPRIKVGQYGLGLAYIQT